MESQSQVNAHKSYSSSMHTPRSIARVPSVQQSQVSASSTAQRIGNLGT